jgi:hypothetical protein
MAVEGHAGLMAGWSRTLSGLFEQASYSAGRFLFWVTAPALATEAWDQIALLSLMNLFMMTLYTSIIGGPSFFRIVRGPEGAALAGYFPCHAVIAVLSGIGPVGYAVLHPQAAQQDPGFLVVLVLVPWVSAAADWSRKTMIVLGRHRVQACRNLLFLALWLGFGLALWWRAAPVRVETLALVFCVLTGGLYLPLRGVLRAARWRATEALAPFSVWRHYLLTGGLAYGLGNALFWIAIDSPSLQRFVILRNYLAPVLLLSMYIESYGALQLEAADQKRQLIGRYLLGVAVATIALACGALGLLQGMGLEVDLRVFGFVVATTFLIAVIKVPTVYLRLRQRDHLVSWVYLALLPLWPLAYGLGLLPVFGLDLLLAQYLLLALGLAAVALGSKPGRVA